MAELGKKLGKLSLAILENFVESKLGKKFVDELRAPTDKSLAMEAALEKSEQRFVSEFPVKEFSARMFGEVSEKSLGLLVDAIGEFYDHPAGLKFQNTLRQILSESFPNIDPNLILSAVEIYIDILTEEFALADEKFQQNVSALSDLRSVNILRRVEKLLSQRDTERAAGAVFRSLHQLPQPPADFTGREELLSQLINDFKTRKGAAISGLVGMGGIGKTTLGLVVAHEIAIDYPDAQIFLDLKGTTAPLGAMDIMRHVVLSFEPGANLRALDETGMQAAYRSVLDEKRALLFLDNARSAEQIASLQPPDTCAMLVTSRWNFLVPGLQSRRVDVMSPENAEKFLIRLCPRIGIQAAQLAKAGACLPLALRIAGSFLQVSDNWEVENYIARLNDRKQILAVLHQDREDAELKTEPDLLATFELSYAQLSEEAQKRWRVLGVFPGSFDAKAAQAIWEMDENETIKLLSFYLRYSQLDYDENASRYSLHDLLADYACSQMDEDDVQAARLKHAAHYKDVLSATNNLYREGNEKVLVGLRLFDLEWENIRVGQAWAVSTKENDPEIARLCIEYPNAGVYVLMLRQHLSERIRWLEAAVSSARKIGDRRGEGNALHLLGMAYFDSWGVRKAIDSWEGQLVIVRENGDRDSEWNTLGCLGMAYASLGEARKAIEFHEQQLVIVREIGNRQGEHDAFNNMGVSYEILGKTRKAIQFFERQLIIAREIGNRRDECGALGLLGGAYVALGETRKGIEFFEHALGIAREISSRLSEGGILGGLGTAYADLGEVHKAIEFHEQQLVIAREFGDRLDEGHALGRLGIAYGALGETHKAFEFHEQALRIAREMEHWGSEMAVLCNLGDAYLASGEACKAIEYYEGHLKIAREIGYRRDEGNALGNLGIAYKALGDVRKAIEYHEQALVIDREIGDRRGEGNALFNMGLALYGLEEKDRAADLVKEALVIYEATESPTAEKARDTLREWGVSI